MVMLLVGVVLGQNIAVTSSAAGCRWHMSRCLIVGMIRSTATTHKVSEIMLILIFILKLPLGLSLLAILLFLG